MWNMGPSQSSFLEASVEAARWIRSTAQATDHGIRWIPDPDQPERATTVTAAPTIYSGNAGVVLFFLELARATADASYMDDVRRGADEIVATWQHVLDTPFFIDNANLDFNHGLSGTAFTLAKVWQATGETVYRDAAITITQRIVEAARPTEAGVEWVGAASAALGDGAIVLYLLWAANAFDDTSLRDIAVQAGRHILEGAEPDPRGGLLWVAFPMEHMGAPPGSYMPNFEFGTAGVALVLARLYAESGERAFLEAAKQGVVHLQSIAVVHGDAALLYHREPDMTDLFYLGYCGGPVGSARVFYELFRITGEQHYADWMERLARGIIASGFPEKQTPGMWNVVCQCCGSAGIIELFTSLFVATGKREHLAYAKRVAEQTLSRATDSGSIGYQWYQAWTRTQPGVVTAETGYMIGAAGVGSAFLHVHLATHGEYDAILFPDNPFPATKLNA